MNNEEQSLYPQGSTEGLISSAMAPSTQETPIVEEESWTGKDIFNVYNPWFGTAFGTGLNKPEVDTGWDPAKSEWVKQLSPDDRVAIAEAKSEEYAQQILARRGLYKESQERLAQDPITTTVLGLGASILDPTLLIPVGATATATKAAYTIGAKATRLAAIAGESAVVSMIGTSASVATETGLGVTSTDYGTANMYALLLGGGLPVAGSMLSSGYSSYKVAKSLTKDPKNLIATATELEVNKLGSPMLKNFYTRFAPDFLKSDVTITASSNNEYIRLVSNRLDSPPMAVVDVNTGEPVAIGTTGQDYKLKFNGRKNLAIGDTRALLGESTFDNLDDFNNEIGKTLRRRALEQEKLVSEELNDAISFTKSEAKMKSKQLREEFMQPELHIRDKQTGEVRPITDEDLKAIEQGRLDTEEYNRQLEEYQQRVKQIDEERKIFSELLDEESKVQMEEYSKQLEDFENEVASIYQERMDYIDTMMEQYYQEGIRDTKTLKKLRQELEDTVDRTITYPVKPKRPTTLKGKDKKINFEERLRDFDENLAAYPLKPTPKRVGIKEDDIIYKEKTKPQIEEFDANLKAQIEEEVAQAIEAKTDELYQKYQVELKHQDPAVVKAAERIDKYYKEILEEGKRLGVHELSKISPNRHYFTRIFDFQKIRETDKLVLVDKIKAAMKAHPANKGMSDSSLSEAANRFASTLKDLDYTREWADYNFFVPKDLGDTSFTVARKYKFDEEMLSDILVNNVEDILGQYSYSQGGHYAVHHAFPELQGIPREMQREEFQNIFIKPLIESRADANEVNALKNMFEDMLGTFRIAKDSNSAIWKGTRIMNSINSMTYGGGFVLNNAAE